MKNPKNFFHTPLPQKNKQDNFGFLKIIIVVVLLGFASGFVGAQVAQTYLYPSQAVKILQGQPIIRPKIAAMPKDTLDMIPLVAFEKKQVTLYPSSKEDFVSKGSALGRGIVLTSDGWIFTSGDVLRSGEDVNVVTYDGRLYDIENFVYDPFTHVSFFQIHSDDLSVVAFKDFNDFYENDSVYIADMDDNLKEYVIIEKNFTPNKSVISFSDQMDEYIKLESSSTDTVAVGSPVFSQDGQVIAMVTQVDDFEILAIALEFLENSIENVLKDGAIKEVSFGFSYVNLENVLATDETFAYRQGAVLKETAQTPLSKSIFSGFLESGDIILSVDGQRVFSPYPLWHLLRTAAASKGEAVIEAIRASTGEKVRVVVPL